MPILDIPITVPSDGQPATTPALGEQSGNQELGPLFGSIWGGSLESAALMYELRGEDCSNGLRIPYPYWNSIYRASYGTYRVMRSQPTLALARSTVMSPIISARPVLEMRKGTEKAIEDFLRDKIIPQRRRIVRDSLRGLDYGWAPFEIVWSIEDGRYVFKLKPMSVDQTHILVNKKGNFVGLRPDAGDLSERDDLLRSQLKAWIFTSDREGDNHHGRARFENVRDTAWADWLDTVQKSRKLREKLSGIIPIIYHPPGGYTDPTNNKFVTYQDGGKAAIKMLKRENGITVEHCGINVRDLRSNPDLAKMSMVFVDFYDAGNYSAAQTGMIEQLRYDDSLFFRGYLLPERTGQQSQFGSRADAQQHTETAAIEAEDTADQIDEQFNEGPIDDALTINWGEGARGAGRIITPPLVNRKAAIFQDIIGKLITAGLGPDIARWLDMNQIAEGVDLPTLGALVVTAVAKSQQAKKGGELSDAQANNLLDALGEYVELKAARGLDLDQNGDREKLDAAGKRLMNLISGR